MEIMGPEGELSSGYKLVPWSSWDQWDFVRESIFSSSPDSISAALRRISAWRSRGCLPVPIDITAAIIEIQQKDPFFSKGPASDVLSSEEMLAMLYCMAIMRLVNGFVEPAHKKTGRSISELADAVGIPRMLIDIRHESSHRDLPSLQLVRLASIKALDWLKSNYWEPQRSAIPDVRKEIRSRLREMSFYLRTKHAEKLGSLQVKRKRTKRSALLVGCSQRSTKITGERLVSKSDGFERKISKITKIIARLYSSYPCEVVSVLFEFFQLQAPDVCDSADMEHSDASNVDDPWPLIGVDDLKTIITNISHKKPRLLLSMLKTVLEMIEVEESTQREKGGYHILSSQHQGERCEINHLCSLVPWLMINLKLLKDFRRIEIVGEAQVLSTYKNAAPKVSVMKLLRKCLTLSTLGNKDISYAVLLLVEMIGDNSLTNKLKKLPSLQLQDRPSTEAFISPATERVLLKEEDDIKKARQELWLLKLQLMNLRTRQLMNLRTRGKNPMYHGKTDTTSSKWTVARSWIPCPIGMLPCSFSSTAVLPDLDKVDDALIRKAELSNDKAQSDHATDKKEADGDIDDNVGASKRPRLTREVQELDFPERTEPKTPMEGQLLIGGIWKKVSEEELLAIESNIRIFV